jgi:hypothetical protein
MDWFWFHHWIEYTVDLGKHFHINLTTRELSVSLKSEERKSHCDVIPVCQRVNIEGN